jgi:hypothetical protein
MMFYWATLYYAGKVVIALGMSTHTECLDMNETIMYDINMAYITQPGVMADSAFPDATAFEAVCRDERLPIDEEYIDE